MDLEPKRQKAGRDGWALTSWARRSQSSAKAAWNESVADLAPELSPAQPCMGRLTRLIHGEACRAGAYPARRDLRSPSANDGHRMDMW